MSASVTVGRRVAAGAALLATALLAGAAGVEGHMKVTEREWAFSSYTRDAEDTKQWIDSVTVVWAGKPTQYTPNRIELALDNQWFGGDWTTDSDCPLPFDSDAQALGYNNAAGGHEGFDYRQDLNLVNEDVRCGGIQFHTRLWNDFEHVALFPEVHDDNDRYTWMVGGVHHEARRTNQDRPGFLGHRLLESFEKTARRLWLNMQFCFPNSRHNWRYLAGSEGRKGRVHYYYSNGYLTKIDLSQKTCGP